MRALVLVVLVALTAARADAQPLRVNVQCENTGRTKACPAFLLGFIDAHKTLLQSPRADADVTVYANATQVALLDRMHLRFVGSVPGAPHLIEIDVDLDSRADDDTQRSQLEPAFLRGMSLFVAARFPKLVTVAFGEPEGEEAKAKHTSPYDFSFETGAFGSWTGEYQNYSAWSNLNVGRVETRKRFAASAWASGGINRQPPLVLDDGTEVSTNTSNYNYGGQLEGAWLYNHCYSVGASTSTWREDPKGQYKYGYDAKLGVEWDRYRADDPRGNRLAVAYIVAYQVDRYNIKNELGERFAHYPKHALLVSGSLRKDKVSLNLHLRVGGELIHPMRRHELSGSPSIEIQLGDHVDINFSFSITKRELPGPLESEIDPMDYAQLSRLSYAEPLSMYGSFNVKLHWDRSNGARNDRLEEL
jgi:hypothetical protein